MSSKFKKSLIKIAVWLLAELILTFTGVDDLADYSEYIFEKASASDQPTAQTVLYWS